MGETKSKEATTISKLRLMADPMNYSPTSGAHKPAARDTMTQFIENKVRQVCPDNNLTPERFKEVLITLEQYGFPQLRDTPTGHRLYEILTVKYDSNSETKLYNKNRSIHGLYRQSSKEL